MSLNTKNTILAGITAIIAGAGYYSWTYADHEQLETADEMVQTKSNVPLSIVISSPEGLPTSPDTNTKLEAVIEKFNELGGDPVTYHWNLPKGVSIQSGELSGVILGLNQTSATISITVQGLSAKEPQNITLDLNTDMQGQTVGATGVFSTHTQNADLSVTPREPASSSALRKANSENAPVKKGMPPKGVHF